MEAALRNHFGTQISDHNNQMITLTEQTLT
jgi:hypothetical protein